MPLVDPACLVLPPLDSWVEVRFVLPGTHTRTVSWLARLEDGLGLYVDLPRFDGLAGRITSAQFSDHMDGRVDRQLEVINRLTGHLTHHCPALAEGRADLCDWKEDS
jgi:hypothetical protein